MVFILRYLDLTWCFISFYNTVMKVVFITISLYLVWLMRCKAPICQTYERSKDCFQYEVYLLGPCFLLGLICTEEYTIGEVLVGLHLARERVHRSAAGPPAASQGG